MAGGDHHSGGATQGPHRPAQAGCGHQLRVQPRPDAVGGEYPAGDPGKGLGLPAAVIGHRHRGVGKAPLQVVRQTLAGPGHGVPVHAVRPRAHDAPEPGGAKGQVPIKGVLDPGAVQLSQAGGQLRIPRLRPPPGIFRADFLFCPHCFSSIIFVPDTTIAYPEAAHNICGQKL